MAAKHIRQFITTILLLSFMISGNAQSICTPPVSFITHAAKVAPIDSQYVLLVTVNVTNDDSIQVKGKRYYEPVSCANNRPEQIWFQKIVRTHRVFVFPDVDRDNFSEYDVGLESITKKHPLQDTIVLDHLISLEQGDYLVNVQLLYYTMEKKNCLCILDIPFHVGFIPKGNEQ